MDCIFQNIDNELVNIYEDYEFSLRNNKNGNTTIIIIPYDVNDYDNWIGYSFTIEKNKNVTLYEMWCNDDNYFPNYFLGSLDINNIPHITKILFDKYNENKKLPDIKNIFSEKYAFTKSANNVV